jgi:hypothetical protein
MFTVVLMRPNRLTLAVVDLGEHAHPVAGSADTALKDCVKVQPLRQFGKCPAGPLY